MGKGGELFARPGPEYRGGNVVYRFTPYRIPLAYDFRVGSRWPDSWRASLRPGWRTRLWERTWGRPRWLPIHGRGVDLDTALAPAAKRTAPASDAERVEWFEPFRCIEVAPIVQPQAWEIVRAVVQPIGTGVLEQIATYLRAQPLDPQGQPVGEPFRTVTDTDPCALPLVHPEGAGDLIVRWRLVAAGYSPERETPAPAMLVAANPAAIPMFSEEIFGIPTEWGDLRYSWGSRYTQGLRHVVLAGPVLLRLFAVLSGPANRWDVRIGGWLAGYWQSAGHRGAAVRAAVTRW